MPTYTVTFPASVCIAVEATSERDAIDKVYALDSDDVLEIDSEPNILPARVPWRYRVTLVKN